MHTYGTNFYYQKRISMDFQCFLFILSLIISAISIHRFGKYPIVNFKQQQQQQQITCMFFKLRKLKTNYFDTICVSFLFCFSTSFNDLIKNLINQSINISINHFNERKQNSFSFCNGDYLNDELKWKSDWYTYIDFLSNRID